MGNSHPKTYGAVRTLGGSVPDEVSSLFFSQLDSGEIETVKDWNLVSKSLSYFNIIPHEVGTFQHSSPSGLSNSQKVESGVLALHYSGNHFLVVKLFTYNNNRYACVLGKKKVNTIIKLDKASSIALDKFELYVHQK